SEAADLATGVFAPHGTLTVSAVNLPAQPAQNPRESRLTWTTAQTDPTIARAVSALVAKRELSMRTRLVLGGGEMLRVASVRPRGANFMSYSETLFNSLHFNGKSAARNEGAFREVPFDEGAEPAEYARVAAELGNDFHPYVVIF